MANTVFIGEVVFLNAAVAFNHFAKKKKNLGDYNMKGGHHVEFKHPFSPVAGLKRMNFVSDQTHSILNKFSLFSLNMRPQGLLSRAGLGCDLNAIT